MVLATMDKQKLRRTEMTSQAVRVAFREIVELSTVLNNSGNYLSQARELRKILIKLREQEQETGVQMVCENPGDYLDGDALRNEGYE